MNTAKARGKLTKAQIVALSYLRDGGNFTGPAPGWNADCILPLPDGAEVDGAELLDLAALGMIAATPIPPPHEEETSEVCGSIVRDHRWEITEAGRTTLARIVRDEGAE